MKKVLDVLYLYVLPLCSTFKDQVFVIGEELVKFGNNKLTMLTSINAMITKHVIFRSFEWNSAEEATTVDLKCYKPYVIFFHTIKSLFDPSIQLWYCTWG